MAGVGGGGGAAVAVAAAGAELPCLLGDLWFGVYERRLPKYKAEQQPKPSAAKKEGENGGKQM